MPSLRTILIRHPNSGEVLKLQFVSATVAHDVSHTLSLRGFRVVTDGPPTSLHTNSQSAVIAAETFFARAMVASGDRSK